jgi:hypothetical protein
MQSVSFTPQAMYGTAYTSVHHAEALLSQWFGRPTVLTSSGRSALLLAFKEAGLTRYSSRLAMPTKTAVCVLDAAVRAAFPVNPATDYVPVQASLIIDQYGHVQDIRPNGPVIEDICHAFFSSATSGARSWRGDMAVFSLPKFFGVAGMSGGLTVNDNAIAERLRTARDTAPIADASQLSQDRADWRTARGPALEALYVRALLQPACDPLALEGLPLDLEAMCNIGQRRRLVVKTLLDSFPDTALSQQWREKCETEIPFALPFFGEAMRNEALARELQNAGFESGVFQIDINRNMFAPEFRLAALMPCHHQITDDQLVFMTSILRKFCA